MGLKEEFQGILRDYGHRILLVRQDKKKRCSCYDEKTQSSSRSCPVCLGLGYTPVIESHLTREIDMASQQSIGVQQNRQSYGDNWVGSRAYYVMPEVQADERDLVVEVEWDKDIPLYRGGGIYGVERIDPARFEKGEIVFQKLIVSDQPVSKSIRGFRIVELAGKVSYELVGGEEA